LVRKEATLERLPVCVIVDEIDGALAAGDNNVVNELCEIVNGSNEQNNEGEAALAGRKKGLPSGMYLKTQALVPGRRAKKKGSKTAPISRPVICICNDPYVPALVPLRRVAKVIFVSQSV